MESTLNRILRARRREDKGKDMERFRGCKWTLTLSVSSNPFNGSTASNLSPRLGSSDLFSFFLFFFSFVPILRRVKKGGWRGWADGRVHWRMGCTYWIVSTMYCTYGYYWILLDLEDDGWMDEGRKRKKRIMIKMIKKKKKNIERQMAQPSPSHRCIHYIHTLILRLYGLLHDYELIVFWFN